MAKYLIMDYKYNVGDIIGSSFEVLEQIRINRKRGEGTTKVKGYLVRCLKDDYVFEIRECGIEKVQNCPCCRGKIVVKGVNDIATTHPHLVKYFINPEDATKVTHGSNKKCLMKCPDCGFEKWMKINSLTRKGFPCNKCGDGVSYPNKFVTNVLTQLNIEIELEKTFDWSNGKKYDVYIPSLEMIIENHGNQHYESLFLKKNKDMKIKTLEEEQENDRYKKELALNNNIKYYIVLDCRKSEMEWIKQSIMESELPKIFEFEERDVDWLECDKYSTKSLVVQACEMWNDGLIVSEIAEKLKVTVMTINGQYLKKGTKLGLCCYDGQEAKSIAISKRKSKTVYVYDLDMNFIKDFKSCAEIQKQAEDFFGIKMGSSNVSKACLENKPYKGYKFSYTPLHIIKE